ncbi:hypothetical protein FACS1894166_07980 [Bacilli bacterium]|nr:hypothetical protein FACS1894166_07980 [Bacilli bacterium]
MGNPLDMLLSSKEADADFFDAQTLRSELIAKATGTALIQENIIEIKVSEGGKDGSALIDTNKVALLQTNKNNGAQRVIMNDDTVYYLTEPLPPSVTSKLPTKANPKSTNPKPVSKFSNVASVLTKPQNPTTSTPTIKMPSDISIPQIINTTNGKITVDKNRIKAIQTNINTGAKRVVMLDGTVHNLVSETPVQPKPAPSPKMKKIDTADGVIEIDESQIKKIESNSKTGAQRIVMNNGQMYYLTSSALKSTTPTPVNRPKVVLTNPTTTPEKDKTISPPTVKKDEFDF